MLVSVSRVGLDASWAAPTAGVEATFGPDDQVLGVPRTTCAAVARQGMLRVAPGAPHLDLPFAVGLGRCRRRGTESHEHGDHQCARHEHRCLVHCVPPPFSWGPVVLGDLVPLGHTDTLLVFVHINNDWYNSKYNELVSTITNENAQINPSTITNDGPIYY